MTQTGLAAFGVDAGRAPTRAYDGSWWTQNGLFRGWLLEGTRLWQGPPCLGCGDMVATSYSTRADLDGQCHGGVPRVHHYFDHAAAHAAELERAMRLDSPSTRDSATLNRIVAWIQNGRGRVPDARILVDDEAEQDDADDEPGGEEE